VKSLFQNIFLSSRLFVAGGIVIAIFAFSFQVPVLFAFAQTLLIGLAALLFTDVVLLFNKNIVLEAKRITANLLSLGSENNIIIHLHNRSYMPLSIRLVDELPYQLQIRDFELSFNLQRRSDKEIKYTIRPTFRGAYHFGQTHCYISSILGLVKRRYTLPNQAEVAVYPSIIEMKKYELRSIQRISFHYGIKKTRRLGQSFEFDQIKEYIPGDDFSDVNWKATSRRSQLMVNHYEDEKSQQVYSIIDKSRVMKMPFNNLSLLDYAINTSLVISNTALGKEDKAGLITFSEKVETVVKADKKKQQLNLILETLYNEKEGKHESDYDMLYAAVKRYVKGRSLLFLYTNFESLYAFQRAMPMMRRIAKSHLLVVVIFENTEIIDYSRRTVTNLNEIYLNTIAQKFVYEKMRIVNAIRQYGIQVILSKPEDLSINSINKYLELKARRMI